jgi:signal transduction histidine kinase
MKKADILLVEDDFVTSAVIKKHLERAGYNVIAVAKDGESAFNLAKDSQPDLILMDISLRNSMDGIETASKIRELYDIPVIYLTADSSSETIERAKITEPFGYLVKPVDGRVLLTNVDLTLQKQIAYNKRILEMLKRANDELEQKVQERTTELYDANAVLRNEIKQRKLAEEELRKAESLATIGKMSAILAHEIRNPLNSIKMNTDILSESLALKDSQIKRFKIIQKEVNRLENLVKEVLMFTRQRELIITEFNLYNLIDNIYQQIKPVLDEKKIYFENKIRKFIIKGDQEKLKQVFLNLILNSADAIFETGTIKIETKLSTPMVDIYIIDSGSGVTDPGRLFEPFYSTKSAGTGLGLPVSQNILIQHGGSLSLVSSRSGETVFLIKLPV